MSYEKIEELEGKVFANVLQTSDECLEFQFPKGSESSGYEFYHAQDCCESVYIAEIIGDLEDLKGLPLTRAEVRTSEDEPLEEGEYYDDLTIWTFYEFATIKGSVTVRWIGSSNGYYGVDVDMREIK